MNLTKDKFIEYVDSLRGFYTYSDELYELGFDIFGEDRPANMVSCFEGFIMDSMEKFDDLSWEMLCEYLTQGYSHRKFDDGSEIEIDSPEELYDFFISTKESEE